MPTVDDYPPRNRDRDGWDYLEGRGTQPPGTPAPSNVVKFPVEPPPHIATAQRIAADAGLLPPVDVAPTDAEPAVIPDERGQALDGPPHCPPDRLRQGAQGAVGMTHGIPRLAPRHAACLVCGEPLPEGRHAQRAYCSATCRSTARRHKAASTLSTAQGAANTHRVAPILTSPERNAPS
jgi:predicted nucleic acid-binding Zn ribbon protein